MNELAPNYYAFCEAILAPKEEFIDGILYKYGLIELEPKELKKLELDEMMELYFKANWTYKRIAEKFGLSDSGAYRRIKKGVKKKMKVFCEVLNCKFNSNEQCERLVLQINEDRKCRCSTLKEETGCLKKE